MKLEDIGFYTLSDSRVEQVSATSPMWRTEIIITDACNFNCPYCRSNHAKGHLSLIDIIATILYWNKHGLKNIRLSGGEPTMHPYLLSIVEYLKTVIECEHIAISTNGSASPELYRQLVEAGVNDFSISLDACCAADGDMMAGNKRGVWERVVENIKMLSELTYVTVGVVLTEDNVESVGKIIEFAHNLGVSDIRVISAAQYNKPIDVPISQEILDAHPILKYRHANMAAGIPMRGLKDSDSHKCGLAVDDSVVSEGMHYPCVIHMREGGEPIGKIGMTMRQERIAWFESHDTHKDPICKNNCLDVCVQYNNFFEATNGRRCFN